MVLLIRNSAFPFLQECFKSWGGNLRSATSADEGNDAHDEDDADDENECDQGHGIISEHPRWSRRFYSRHFQASSVFGRLLTRVSPASSTKFDFLNKTPRSVRKQVNKRNAFFGSTYRQLTFNSSALNSRSIQRQVPFLQTNASINSPLAVNSSM